MEWRESSHNNLSSEQRGPEGTREEWKRAAGKTRKERRSGKERRDARRATVTAAGTPRAARALPRGVHAVVTPQDVAYWYAGIASGIGAGV